MQQHKSLLSHSALRCNDRKCCYVQRGQLKLKSSHRFGYMQRDNLISIQTLIIEPGIFCIFGV